VLPGALVGAWVYARLVRAPPRVLLDAAAPGLALTVAVGRWGCWFNGCCFGRETASLLGVYAPDLWGVWARRFPTQLLESVLSLAIFALLWRLRRHKPFEGYLILLLVALYFTARFFLSFLRGDNNYLPGGFSEMQFYSLLVVAACTAWISRELGHAKRALNGGSSRLVEVERHGRLG
jgi:phosphatidylglycerol:prolipoprotein diacylglycerol transferase